jgi:methylthioribulose 1-phosphate dehydratase/enolase-phosphatase E1
MAAAVPGTFYVDDPQDGASLFLLSSLGVTLFRGVAAASAEEKNFVATPHSTALSHALTQEHSFSFPPALYSVSGGGAVLDVRDSGDAWLRIVLHDGDAVRVREGLFRRVGDASTVRSPVAMPTWERHADARSSSSSVVFTSPASGQEPGRLVLALPAGCSFLAPVRRHDADSPEAAAAADSHWLSPCTPHPRDLVSDLCAAFYTLGWVTGTGGSISIRHGDRVFMAPSGVQKERMQPQDIFVLDASGAELTVPRPLPRGPTLKLSQCAPLFQHAFNLRGAGACIHTHDINAVMVTLLAGTATEFVITHQEMIKGIAGHGFLDSCAVPIIENTPHECDLADSLGEAMARYPRANAVLVRRHGVYVWGSSWAAAKTQAECYHYLFEAAVKMRAIGVDPGATPARVADGIGANKSYGSGKETASAYFPSSGGAAAHVHAADCCGDVSVPAAAALEAATSSGFHGTAGTSALRVAVPPPAMPGPDAAPTVPPSLPSPSSYSKVLLDIEGCTTSIAFVTETLFPYAAQHAAAWLDGHWGGAECRSDAAALRAQWEADVGAGGAEGEGAAAVPVSAAHVDTCVVGADAASKGAAIAALVANVVWQMGLNRKTGALKALQGHIWKDGYASGELKAHVYEDTVRALAGWAEAGMRAYIYSSGSREAQRLLFAHSSAGDLRTHLHGYFDTSSGSKVEASSYISIAQSLGVDSPSEVLFCTDSLAEAVAARAAGMQVVVTDRPGNVALPPSLPFPVVTSLMQLL